ncbi:hypothetical protein [Geobacter grbiciae]|uniref:hypothetical protein n=1 Tax=Geobacter grbiciae TaxID=155042 RepID=UPI001C025AA6|nr:hypothetical protein [Geobacter grbiciae]MBT1074249.1 hypothetical protein [Geobacter grbiciae]
MQKAIFLALLLIAAMLSACAQNVELIKSASVTTRNDVFQELPEKVAIPPGYADLYIFASLKTHRPGVYPTEKKSHGTAEYMLLINIDGQATRIRGKLKEEESEPRFLRDPEAGEGIRYNFRKDVRLRAGPHRIAVAIPEDDIIIVNEVTLPEGSSNILLMEPVYGTTAMRRRPAFYGGTSFTQGVKGFKAYLNGRPLQDDL